MFFMGKIIKGILLSLFIFIIYVGSVTVDVDVEGYNEPVMSLDVSSSRIDFGPVNPERKDKIYNNALTINVKSNVSWELTIELLDELTNENGYKLKDGSLKYRNRSGIYESLYKGNPVVIAVGGPTNEKGVSIPMNMKLTVDWVDEAGTYRTVLRYTLNPQP